MDAYVGKEILEKCLTRKLKTKTRALITHKVESLRYVDYVYIFKSGSIVAEGDFHTIRQSFYYKEIEEKSKKQFADQEKVQETSLHEVQSQHLENKPKNNELNKQKISTNKINKSTEMTEKLMINGHQQTDSFSLAVWKEFFTSFGSVKYFIMVIFGLFFFKTI